jgi:hypothetical protein
VYEEIQELLDNYIENPVAPEQDAKVKNTLQRLKMAMFRSETENGELVEKILKAERAESALLYEMTRTKDSLETFINGWTPYKYN